MGYMATRLFIAPDRIDGLLTPQRAKNNILLYFYPISSESAKNIPIFNYDGHIVMTVVQNMSSLNHIEKKLYGDFYKNNIKFGI